MIFHKPTYGLDLKTTEHVREVIRDLVRNGMAVVVISTDLDELLELCHRVAVLSRGRLAGVVDNGPDAVDQVGSLMIGMSKGQEAA